MSTRRALALLLGVILLIAGASLALGQPGGPRRPLGGPGPGGGGPFGPGPGGDPRAPGAPAAGGSIEWIDVHVHLIAERGDYRGAVAAAVAAMDEAGIAKMVVMPPPQVSSQATRDTDDFVPALAFHRKRFAFLGGGGSLNPMIHDTRADAVGETIRRRFETRATEILKQGAAGFGEIAGLHISAMSGHPFESVDADHPLLLLLADVAGRHGAVIDLHCDLVAEDIKAPEWLASPPNPPTFRANLGGLERLLEHNRNARIVWAHAGSDVFGHWTVAFSRRLLAKHPNLFMSLRMAPWRAPQNHPLLPDGTIKPEWLSLLQEFPDRFVLGGDQFIVSPGLRGSGPGVTFSQRAPMMRQRSRIFLGALPPDLARKIGAENAIRLYRLE